MDTQGFENALQWPLLLKCSSGTVNGLFTGLCLKQGAQYNYWVQYQEDDGTNSTYHHGHPVLIMTLSPMVLGFGPGPLRRWVHIHAL